MEGLNVWGIIFSFGIPAFLMGILAASIVMDALKKRRGRR